MASSSVVLRFLVLISLLFFSEPTSISSSLKPNLLILPVQMDDSCGLHWAYIHKRTPLVKVPVLVDLNGKVTWVNCDQHYLSSTYTAPFCHSTQCARANTHFCHSCPSASRPGCHNNTCGLMPLNPLTHRSAVAELAQDLLAIYSLPSSNQMVTIPRFLFACAPSSLQKDLPKTVQGVAGLGQDPIALPIQLASHFGLPRQFAMCLSGDPKSTGAIFFGEPPNVLRPSFDISRHLVYTPLTVSPLREYHIRVTSIKINNQVVVPVNPSLLTPTTSEGHGIGGAMITTALPLTLLHHSIFQALIQVYASQVPKQTLVKAEEPFGLCFDSRKIGKAPTVELVLDRPNAVWTLSGENLMVEANPGVMCLAFWDAGEQPRAAIMIGARQLQDNFVVFDLARSTFGFSSSLLARGTECANYKFSFSP